jgi:hypothetical protein
MKTLHLLPQQKLKQDDSRPSLARFIKHHKLEDGKSNQH